MMQGLEKLGTGTGESYRYPDARVTANAVWRLRIVLVRGVLGVGAHYIARDPVMGIIIPVMGIIIPMKPAIEGAGSGR